MTDLSNEIRFKNFNRQQPTFRYPNTAYIDFFLNAKMPLHYVSETSKLSKYIITFTKQSALNLYAIHIILPAQRAVVVKLVIVYVLLYVMPI